jgi:hypothetical protein
MKNLTSLLTEITELTNTIESDYPELYQFLDENPMTLPAEAHPEMDQAVMQEYLESLKKMLAHHLETHRNKTVNE